MDLAIKLRHRRWPDPGTVNAAQFADIPYTPIAAISYRRNGHGRRPLLRRHARVTVTTIVAFLLPHSGYST